MTSMVNNTDKKGFSLVEIMIVIAIMAILAGIAAPFMQPYMAQRRLSGAARQVHTDLLAMRMQAAGENKWIALNVDDAQQYTIFRDHAKTGVKSSPGNEILAVKDLHPTYHDVTFTSAANTVVPFAPNGTACFSDGSCVLATLGFSSPGGTKSITVTPAGAAKIN